MLLIRGLWGCELDPESTKEICFDSSVKITMVTLGKASEKKKKGNGKKTSVNISFSGSPNYTLCTFKTKKCEHTVIDLTILKGEKVTLTNSGLNPVHLLGNYISQHGVDSDDSDSSEEEFDTMSVIESPKSLITEASTPEEEVESSDYEALIEDMEEPYEAGETSSDEGDDDRDSSDDSEDTVYLNRAERQIARIKALKPMHNAMAGFFLDELGRIIGAHKDHPSVDEFMQYGKRGTLEQPENSTAKNDYTNKNYQENSASEAEESSVSDQEEISGADGDQYEDTAPYKDTNPGEEQGSHADKEKKQDADEDKHTDTFEKKDTGAVDMKVKEVSEDMNILKKEDIDLNADKYKYSSVKPIRRNKRKASAVFEDSESEDYNSDIDETAPAAPASTNNCLEDKEAFQTAEDILTASNSVVDGRNGSVEEQFERPDTLNSHDRNVSRRLFRNREKVKKLQTDTANLKEKASRRKSAKNAVKDTLNLGHSINSKETKTKGIEEGRRKAPTVAKVGGGAQQLNTVATSTAATTPVKILHKANGVLRAGSNSPLVSSEDTPTPISKRRGRKKRKTHQKHSKV